MFYGNLSRKDVVIPAFGYRTMPKIEGYNVGFYFNKAGPKRAEAVQKYLFD